jgi:hypothetical protein
MTRVHDAILVLLVALIVMIIATMARGRQWADATAVTGFLCLTVAWIAMYVQLRREDPDHPLARASYVGRRNASNGRWNGSNVFDLVGLHWQRHRMDTWITLLILGLAVMAAAALWKSL